MLNIAVTTDSNFLYYTVVLIKSIIANTDSCLGWLFVRLVDCDNNIHNIVKSISPKIRIIIDNANLSRKNTIMMRGVDVNHPRFSSLRARLCSPHHCYCAHSKFSNLQELLNLELDNILILDADKIVRRNLEPLVSNLYSYDMCLKRENISTFLDIRGMRIYSEAVMVFKNTQHTRMFARTLLDEYNEVKKTSKFDIDSDTTSLAKTVHKYSCVSILDMPPEYQDTSMSDDSYIWSGQANVKQSDRFLSECMKYEDNSIYRKCKLL